MTSTSRRRLLAAAIALTASRRRHGRAGAGLADQADPRDRAVDRRQRDRRHGARRRSDQVSAQLGQPIIVENRPGAGNTIGMSAVAKAEPDGYTILVNSSTHTVTPATRSNLGFEMTDLAAIVPLGNMPVVMVFNPSKGYKTLSRLRRHGEGQSRQDQLRLGRRRQFVASQRRTVPARGRLRGRAPAVQGRAGSADRGDRRPRRLLLRAAGQRTAARSRDGQVQALAVSGSARASALPDVPTTVEAGYPNSEYNFWVGMFAAGEDAGGYPHPALCGDRQGAPKPGDAREARRPRRRSDAAELGAVRRAGEARDRDQHAAREGRRHQGELIRAPMSPSRSDRTDASWRRRGDRLLRVPRRATPKPRRRLSPAARPRAAAGGPRADIRLGI